MQEVFEKIIEQLETVSDYEPIEYDYNDTACVDEQRFISTDDAIEIVKQTAAEYDNGWIPVSERLPDLGKRILLQDFGGNITLEKCELKKRVKGFTDGNLWASADNYIAWQPLPAPYQPKGE